MRVVAPNQPHYHRRDSRLLSSPPSVGGAGLEQTSLNLSSQEMSSLPQLEVVSEEGRGSDNVFETRSGSSKDKHSVSSGELVLEGYTPPPPTHGANQDVTETSNIPSRYKSRRFLQRQASADDLLKRASPYYLLEEDCPMCEVWVSASNAKHATVSVIDYTQRFINLEASLLTISSNAQGFTNLEASLLTISSNAQGFTNLEASLLTISSNAQGFTNLEASLLTISSNAQGFTNLQASLLTISSSAQGFTNLEASLLTNFIISISICQ